MSNNYWDEDEDDQDESIDAPMSDGSDLLKKLRKAKRSDEKRIKELTEQLEGLSKGQRERTVKDVLEKQGINPKVARLLLKDVDEVSEESVSAWLQDNADLFTSTTQESSKTQEQIENEDELSRQDNLSRSGGLPGTGNRTADLLAAATTRAEFDAIIAAASQ